MINHKQIANESLSAISVIYKIYKNGYLEILSRERKREYSLLTLNNSVKSIKRLNKKSKNDWLEVLNNFNNAIELISVNSNVMKDIELKKQLRKLGQKQNQLITNTMKKELDKHLVNEMSLLSL